MATTIWQVGRSARQKAIEQDDGIAFVRRVGKFRKAELSSQPSGNSIDGIDHADSAFRRHDSIKPRDSCHHRLQRVALATMLGRDLPHAFRGCIKGRAMAPMEVCEANL